MQSFRCCSFSVLQFFSLAVFQLGSSRKCLCVIRNDLLNIAPDSVMLPEQALAVECGLEFASACTLPAREVAAACEIYSGAIRHNRRFKARRCSSAGLRTAPHEGASLMVREGKGRSNQRMLGRTCAQRLLGSPQWPTLPVLGSLGLGARGDGSRFMISECILVFRCLSSF